MSKTTYLTKVKQILPHNVANVVKEHVQIEILLINSVKIVVIPLKPLSDADVQSHRPGKDNSILLNICSGRIYKGLEPFVL